MLRYSAGHFTVLKTDQWMILLQSDFLLLYILVLFLSILTLSPKEKQKKEGGKKKKHTLVNFAINRVGKKKLLNDF